MNSGQQIALDPLWFLKDDEILSRIVMKFEAPLTEDQVAEMLGISRKTLQRWIDDRQWMMPVGPDGKRRMTLAQFREQFALTHKMNGR